MKGKIICINAAIHKVLLENNTIILILLKDIVGKN